MDGRGVDPNARDVLREPSRRAILTEIRMRREISRIELSDVLGISPATVTAGTADLIAAGFVLELEKAPEDGRARRGRPPVMLSLNPAALRFAGAKISDRAITVVILDFLGQVVASTETEREPGHSSASALVATLSQAVDLALQEKELDRADLAGLGVGVPGFIDHAAGLVHWSPLFSAMAPDFMSLLADDWPCPVSIDNDANLAALAELRSGYGRGQRDFLTVTIEHGVGLGMVMNGEIHRGARGIGAEFGHTKVRTDGALCRCGQRGCLEAYIADYALAHEAKTLFYPDAAGQDTGVTGPLERLQSAANDGDERARAVYLRAARMLGVGIANLANLLDPSLIILSGERMRHGPLFVDEMASAMGRNVLKIDRPLPEIKIHRWGATLWARGGAQLATDEWLAHAGLGAKRLREAV